MNHQNKQSTVLLAGARGFVGRHVVNAFAEFAPSTRIIRLVRPAVIPRSLEGQIDWDLCDDRCDELAKQMQLLGVTAVVNCTGTTVSQPGLLQAENVQATERLVAAAVAAKSDMVFCQIGSGAEYEMLSRPEKTREDTPTRPQGEYGRSKLDASKIVINTAQQGGLKGYVLRFFNPLGVGMPSTQLLGRVTDYLKGDSSYPLRLGSLDSYRDYVDARDAARAIVLSLAKADDIFGEIFNVGTGSARSTRELVQMIFSGIKTKTFLEDSMVGSPRSDWANWQEADIAKIDTFIRWRPAFSFEETISYLSLQSCESGFARRLLS